MFFFLVLLVGLVGVAQVATLVWAEAPKFGGASASLKNGVDIQGWNWWQIPPIEHDWEPVRSFPSDTQFATVRAWVENPEHGRYEHRFYVGAPERATASNIADYFGLSRDAPMKVPTPPWFSANPQRPIVQWRRRVMWKATPGMRTIPPPGDFSSMMEPLDEQAVVVMLFRPENDARLGDLYGSWVAYRERKTGGREISATAGAGERVQGHQGQAYVSAYAQMPPQVLGKFGMMVPAAVNPASNDPRPVNPRLGAALLRGVIPAQDLRPWQARRWALILPGKIVPLFTDNDRQRTDGSVGRGAEAWRPCPISPDGDMSPWDRVTVAVRPCALTDQYAGQVRWAPDIPVECLTDILEIGNAREGDENVRVGIPLRTRRTGMAISGNPGTGKTVLMTNILNAQTVLEEGMGSHVIFSTKQSASDGLAAQVTMDGRYQSSDWQRATEDQMAVARVASTPSEHEAAMSLIDPTVRAHENANRIVAALSYVYGSGMQDRAEQLARDVLTLSMLMPQYRLEAAAEAEGWERTPNVAEVATILLGGNEDVRMEHFWDVDRTNPDDVEGMDSKEWATWGSAMNSLRRWYPESTRQQQPKTDTLDPVKNKLDPLTVYDSWWRAGTPASPSLADIVNRRGVTFVRLPLGPGGDATPVGVVAHMLLSLATFRERNAGDPEFTLYHDELAHIAGAGMSPPAPVQAALDQGREASATLVVAFQRIEQLHPQVVGAINSMGTFISFAQSDPETIAYAWSRLNIAGNSGSRTSEVIARLPATGTAFVSTRASQALPPFEMQTDPPRTTETLALPAPPVALSPVPTYEPPTDVDDTPADEPGDGLGTYGNAW